MFTVCSRLSGRDSLLDIRPNFYSIYFRTSSCVSERKEMAVVDVDQRIRDIQREYADFLDDYVISIFLKSIFFFMLTCDLCN